MSEYRQAQVYNHGRLAGTLAENDRGYAFIYDAHYLADDTCPPISLTLLKQEAAYESPSLFSFFDGLIPEGWVFYTVLKKWGISRKDRFGVLLVACRDCIGSVSIRRVDA